MLKTVIEAIKRGYNSQPHLFVVLISGIVGGLLAASAQALFRTSGYLEAFAIPKLSPGQYTIFGIFGALAAGFSVYMAANSRREDLLHLCFFSLSCGIAFPAILLETQTKVAKEAQQQVESVKNIVKDGSQAITDVAPAAAATVTTTVSQTPASQVDAQTRAIVTNDTSKIIQQLDSANSPVATAAAQEIFQAAQQAGYTAVQAPTQVPQTQAPAQANVPTSPDATSNSS